MFDRIFSYNSDLVDYKGKGGDINNGYVSLYKSFYNTCHCCGKALWYGFHMFSYGYGSIPINTIFSGMNSHLPAILGFTRGTRFWPIPILFYGIYTYIISDLWDINIKAILCRKVTPSARCISLGVLPVVAIKPWGTNLGLSENEVLQNPMMIIIPF